MSRACRMPRSLAAALLLGIPVVALAQQLPDGANPRIQKVIYDPNAIVAVRLAPGYVGTVIFPEAEVVENVVLGDAGAWQVKASRRGDQIYIKANGGVQTSNMHVVTSRHQYNFTLIQVPESDPGFMMQMTIVALDEQPAPALPSPTFPASRINGGGYRLRGDRRPKPSSIVVDGQRTVIEWPVDVPFPAIFAIDGGHEILLSPRFAGNRAMIDRVWPHYVFRLDRLEAHADFVPSRGRQK